jgi:hypothetical protein
VFEPEIVRRRRADRRCDRCENNQAEAVSFVSGEVKVLVVREIDEDASQAFAAAFTDARRSQVEVRTAEQMPGGR